MKLRADLYRREAGELLRNISMYPGLSETQLSRFFPGKEESVHTLLSHMIHTGRAILSAEGRFFSSAEQLDRYDPLIAHAVWVLLDLMPQVEYHSIAEFPATLLCFAGGQMIEIVCVPPGREVLIGHVLQQRGKDDTQVIALVDDVAQIFLLSAACITAFCTVGADGHISYYQKAGEA